MYFRFLGKKNETVSSTRRIKLLAGMIVSLLGVACLATALLVVGPHVHASHVVSSHGGSGSGYGPNGPYQQTNLVSDMAGKAQVTDPNMRNPWGISFGPKSAFWLSDNATGLSTLYNTQGKIVPLVVTIPAPKGTQGPASPTGTVFNGSSNFVVSQNGKSGPGLFIFSTEDGTISAWNPTVDGTHAILEVDNSQGGKGAVYKGLALEQNMLFATNFRSGKVDVFDAQFHALPSFTDSYAPAGYAPFGIQNIGGLLYVSFAKQDAAKHDDVSGPGPGFVDVFKTDGSLVSRLIAGGKLNSPWGFALAPATFGQFSNALLVGNFGDGHINAYDVHTGRCLGTVKDKQGNALVNDGLWALAFGNGAQAGDVNTLYFTAGLNKEQDGLFGGISVAP